MNRPVPVHVRVQRADFDAAAEVARLTAARNDIGAVVTFQGLCRDEHGRLAVLELEHYPGMAEAEIRRIAAEAARRWPVTGLAVIHRYGRIAVGGNIVLVAAASPHRHAAFEAAAFLMDFLKTGAPFWKREHLADGGAGPWVEARGEDDEAQARWRPGGRAP
ncbi:MAG: molybdenum cofactor biosynthesis protein MoaE [Aquamicrobium sp.]|uniref:molybdenum cofactor biosynthesis protein MoaE n=1 Tax=Aquamicrobium sp. TaxID=1872579 RepID=UPI00349EEB84|nr:molybdenum cofactor biosynthesis protein MoaE [Aquamicrobium sp.]